jgi:hypothetical protein
MREARNTFTVAMRRAIMGGRGAGRAAETLDNAVC